MTLASAALLAGVVSAWTPLYEVLAGWLSWIAALETMVRARDPDPFPQCGIDGLPGAVQALPPEAPSGRFFGGQGKGQCAPLTAESRHGEDGVHDLPAVVDGRFPPDRGVGPKTAGCPVRVGQRVGQVEVVGVAGHGRDATCIRLLLILANFRPFHTIANV